MYIYTHICSQVRFCKTPHFLPIHPQDASYQVPWARPSPQDLGTGVRRQQRLAHWVQEMRLGQRAETWPYRHRVKINWLQRSPWERHDICLQGNINKGEWKQKSGSLRDWSKPAGQAGPAFREEGSCRRAGGWRGGVGPGAGQGSLSSHALPDGAREGKLRMTGLQAFWDLN